MSDWRLENIDVDRIHQDEFVVDINGERHILTEREADTLMGELSVYGAVNPNKGRYKAYKRKGNNE